MFYNFCSNVFGMIYKDSLARRSSRCRTKAGYGQDKQANNDYNTLWQVLLQSYVQVTWEAGKGMINWLLKKCFKKGLIFELSGEN